MEYAPVLIPTLCRSEHFIRCIESLKRNTWAQYTDIYIALDYPIKESHRRGYNKICKYLEGDFEEFASFNVIKRPFNYGVVKNMEQLRIEILDKYNCYIRSDDDCEFSPNFLEYMDRCLEKYKDDETVIGVTGYSYPINWDIPAECNAFKSSLIFPMWGAGFWKDKFLSVQKELAGGYIKEYSQKNFVNRKKMTDARYLECMDSAFNYDSDNFTMRTTDVAYGCYMQIANKFVITPKLSKVRNYGFDGSGVYCQNTLGKRRKKEATYYDYTKQKIDTAYKFLPSVEENYDFESNKKILNQFDFRSRKKIIMGRVKYIGKKIIVRIFGEKRYIQIRNMKSGQG